MNSFLCSSHQPTLLHLVRSFFPITPPLHRPFCRRAGPISAKQCSENSRLLLRYIFCSRFPFTLCVQLKNRFRKRGRAHARTTPVTHSSKVTVWYTILYYVYVPDEQATTKFRLKSFPFRFGSHLCCIYYSAALLHRRMRHVRDVNVRDQVATRRFRSFVLPPSLQWLRALRHRPTVGWFVKCVCFLI